MTPTAMLLLGMPGTTELLIIAGILILLFGANRVPALMRGMGEGIRDLRKGVAGTIDEPADTTEETTGGER